MYLLYLDILKNYVVGEVVDFFCGNYRYRLICIGIDFVVIKCIECIYNGKIIFFVLYD